MRPFARRDPRSPLESARRPRHPRRTGLVAGGLAVILVAGVPAAGALADALSDDEPTASLHMPVRAPDEPSAAELVHVQSDGLSEQQPEPEEQAGPDPEPQPEPDPEPEAAEGSRWDRLADCESGDWDADGRPIPGTARWDYGAPGGFAHEGYEQFQGGLNFDPDTWDWVREAVGVDHEHAYEAPREAQIRVAERVLEQQGWEAWPVCSRKVGLR